MMAQPAAAPVPADADALREFATRLVSKVQAQSRELQQMAEEVEKAASYRLLCEARLAELGEAVPLDAAGRGTAGKRPPSSGSPAFVLSTIARSRMEALELQQRLGKMEKRATAAEARVEELTATCAQLRATADARDKAQVALRRKAEKLGAALAASEAERTRQGDYITRLEGRLLRLAGRAGSGLGAGAASPARAASAAPPQTPPRADGAGAAADEEAARLETGLLQQAAHLKRALESTTARAAEAEAAAGIARQRAEEAEARAAAAEGQLAQLRERAASAEADAAALLDYVAELEQRQEVGAAAALRAEVGALRAAAAAERDRAAEAAGALGAELAAARTAAAAAERRAEELAQRFHTFQQELQLLSQPAALEAYLRGDAALLRSPPPASADARSAPAAPVMVGVPGGGGEGGADGQGRAAAALAGVRAQLVAAALAVGTTPRAAVPSPAAAAPAAPAADAASTRGERIAALKRRMGMRRDSQQADAASGAGGSAALTAIAPTVREALGAAAGGDAAAGGSRGTESWAVRSSVASEADGVARVASVPRRALSGGASSDGDGDESASARVGWRGGAGGGAPALPRVMSGSSIATTAVAGHAVHLTASVRAAGTLQPAHAYHAS